MRIRAKTLRRTLERGSTYGVTVLGVEMVQIAPGMNRPCVLFVVDNQVATYAVSKPTLDAAGDGWVEATLVTRADRPIWMPAGNITTM